MTYDKTSIRGLAWTGSGDRVVFSSKRGGGDYRLWSIRPSSKSILPIPSRGGTVSDPSITTSDVGIAFVDTVVNWNIWRMRHNGTAFGNPERFISSSGRNHVPRISPDGSKIAFVSDRSGSWEIWLCDADASNLKQLTHFGGPWVGGLSWSPDGKRIAFDSRPDGHAAVFTISADGGKPERIEKGAFEERMPSWSPDGRWLYFNSNRSGPVSIWKRPTSGDSPVVPVVSAGFTAYEAPNGGRFFFDQSSGGIWTLSPDGNVVPLSLLAGVKPNLNWTVAHDGIYFINGDESTQIWMYRFADASVRAVGEMGKASVMYSGSLTVAPDETWLLYAQQDFVSSDIRIRRGPLTEE